MEKIPSRIQPERQTHWEYSKKATVYDILINAREDNLHYKEKEGKFYYETTIWDQPSGHYKIIKRLLSSKCVFWSWSASAKTGSLKVYCEDNNKERCILYYKGWSSSHISNKYYYCCDPIRWERITIHEFYYPIDSGRISDEYWLDFYKPTPPCAQPLNLKSISLNNKKITEGENE